MGTIAVVGSTDWPSATASSCALGKLDAAGGDVLLWAVTAAGVAGLLSAPFVPRLRLDQMAIRASKATKTAASIRIRYRRCLCVARPLAAIIRSKAVRGADKSAPLPSLSLVDVEGVVCHGRAAVGRGIRPVLGRGLADAGRATGGRPVAAGPRARRRASSGALGFAGAAADRTDALFFAAGWGFGTASNGTSSSSAATSTNIGASGASVLGAGWAVSAAGFTASCGTSSCRTASSGAEMGRASGTSSGS